MAICSTVRADPLSVDTQIHRRGMSSEGLLVEGYLVTGEIFLPSACTDRHDLVMYAARRGWTLVRVVQECAPGPGHASPKLLDTVARVESGDIDGIIAPSLWHVGASLAEVTAVVERVSAARGTFCTVRENFDTSTSAGRIVARLLAHFAAFSNPPRDAQHSPTSSLASRHSAGLALRR